MGDRVTIRQAIVSRASGVAKYGDAAQQCRASGCKSDSLENGSRHRSGLAEFWSRVLTMIFVSFIAPRRLFWIANFRLPKSVLLLITPQLRCIPATNLSRDLAPRFPRLDCAVGRCTFAAEIRCRRARCVRSAGARVCRPAASARRSLRADRQRVRRARSIERRPMDERGRRRHNGDARGFAAREPVVADGRHASHPSPLARRSERHPPHPRRRVGARLRRSRVARLGARSRDAVVLRDVRRIASRTRTACAPARRRSASGRSIREGISLWADVRSGGVGVQLGDRDARRVRRRRSRGPRRRVRVRGDPRVLQADVSPTRGCRRSRSTAATIGTGRTERTAPQTVLADAQHIVELSPDRRESSVRGDRRRLAAGARRRQARASARGIAATRSSATCPGSPRRSRMLARGPASGFVRCRRRPTRPTSWRLPRDRTFLDPDRARRAPEDRRRHRRVSRAGAIELIKHDYTTFDIFGRWGSQMGAAMTRDGWTFAVGPDAHDGGSDRRSLSRRFARPRAMRSSSAATP